MKVARCLYGCKPEAGDGGVRMSSAVSYGRALGSSPEPSNRVGLERGAASTRVLRVGGWPAFHAPIRRYRTPPPTSTPIPRRLAPSGRSLGVTVEQSNLRTRRNLRPHGRDHRGVGVHAGPAQLRIGAFRVGAPTICAPPLAPPRCPIARPPRRPQRGTTLLRQCVRDDLPVAHRPCNATTSAVKQGTPVPHAVGCDAVDFQGPAIIEHPSNGAADAGYAAYGARLVNQGETEHVAGRGLVVPVDAGNPRGDIGTGCWDYPQAHPVTERRAARRRARSSGATGISSPTATGGFGGGAGGEAAPGESTRTPQRTRARRRCRRHPWPSRRRAGCRTARCPGESWRRRP